MPVEEAAQAAAVAMQKIANLKASKRPPVVSEWEIDYPVLTPRNCYISYIIICISRLIYYNYKNICHTVYNNADIIYSYYVSVLFLRVGDCLPCAFSEEC
eukprot:COSAG06_NODE_34612_length_472_cov_0.825737_1_plen_100_part_00